MMNVNIDVDLNEIDKKLDVLGRTQLPFAASRTINRALTDAQGAIIDHAKSVMEIRREQFLKLSYKITKFSKKDDLTATLELVDLPGRQTADIWLRQEKGGEKTPKNGGSVAIPTRAVRTNTRGIVQKSQRPRNLKNSFRSDIKGKDVIAQRQGSKKNPKVVVKWLLRPSVTVPKRLNFFPLAPNTFEARFNGYINEELAKAISTAKL